MLTRFTENDESGGKFELPFMVDLEKIECAYWDYVSNISARLVLVVGGQAVPVPHAVHHLVLKALFNPVYSAQSWR
jgi:hypothetical protein